MTAKEVLMRITSTVQVTQKAIADMLGWDKQVLWSKLARDSLRFSEFMEIMDKLGIEVTYRIKETGEEIPIHTRGCGRRVKGKFDGVLYDTLKSEPIASSFFADGENEYDEQGEAQELYVDDCGRYFFAQYVRDDPKKDRIFVVPNSIAAAFIEKYGTGKTSKEK